MKIPPAVAEVHRRLKDAGYKAFVVGGCVRDMVLGREPKDFDLTTSALPEQVQQVFKKVIPTGIQHGTVTVVVQGQHIEVTTFRSEGPYLDGRRPEKVEFHSDIEADLARRDFTINAMAYDPITDEIVDPFDGRSDLKAKTVRCVRDPLERFGEDGLRCLRAVRFATVLDFAIDPPTESAIAPTLPVFRKVAFERVRDELLKILASLHARRGLDLLQRTGLLAAIFGDTTLDLDGAGRPLELELRLAALLRPAGIQAAERLKLSSAQLDRLRKIMSGRPPAATDDVALRRWLSAAGVAAANDLATLDAPELLPRIDAVLATKPPLATRDLALDGAAIMAALGVGPGPLVGQASRHLLDRVLDDPELNTPQKLREILASFKA